MKIGNIDIGEGALLAPMAGFTDAGFRHLSRKYGAALTYTEMVSIKGLEYNNPHTKDLLYITDIEKPAAVQLFGSDIKAYVKVLSSGILDKFDIIDINMGCPVRKIVANGEGSALMKNIPQAVEIVKVCKTSGKPVTVKFRSGYEKTTATEFAKAMEGAGADAITVHGRTREQFYSGEADWNVIRDVVNSVSIPVVGNGDVRRYDDIYRMKERTGVNAVMIGRAALGSPYIFSDYKPSTSEIKEDILTHIAILGRIYKERVLTNLMKKHLCFYGRLLKDYKQLKCDVNSLKDLTMLYEIVDRYFVNQ